jgi:hypothetical protein
LYVILLSNIRNGYICSLLVEEIDLGNGNVRQVVSGLAKFFSPEEIVVGSQQQQGT